MRTTIKIDDHLLADAKAQAAQSGRTLNQVVEDALRESLGRRSRSVHEQPLALPTFAGELRPGVDLDDNSVLLDLVEGSGYVWRPTRRGTWSRTRSLRRSQSRQGAISSLQIVILPASMGCVGVTPLADK